MGIDIPCFVEIVQMTISSMRPSDGFKFCTKCGEEKPLQKFYNSKRALDGKSSECNSCAIQRTMAWKKENKEKQKTYNKKWADKNKIRGREAARKYRTTEKAKVVRNKYLRTACKRDVDKITDRYVKSILVRDTSLSYKDIPQELIKLKRQQILLRRKVHENSGRA